MYWTGLGMNDGALTRVIRTTLPFLNSFGLPCIDSSVLRAARATQFSRLDKGRQLVRVATPQESKRNAGFWVQHAIR